MIHNRQYDDQRQCSITHISDEGCVGVGRPDVIVLVELPVGWHVQLVGGVKVGVAPVSTPPTFVKPCIIPS